MNFAETHIAPLDGFAWAFFSQAFDADGGCREAVRKLQAVAAQAIGVAASSGGHGMGSEIHAQGECG
jgi:hypothetical protein